MEIGISVRNGQITDQIQDKIRQKVAKLPRFCDKVTKSHITADLRHTDKPQVEITVSAEDTHDFFAADTGSNVMVALDSVLSKMESQLKKHNEKLKDHRTTEPNIDDPDESE